MNQDIAIKVEDLTKIYKLYDAPIDRLKEALNPFKKKYHKDFYALDNLTFEIKKGDCVGILGKNGAGKSTLLKIITGVLTPTIGRVEINGKVSALLELGAGFNPEYTGMENIYFQGNLMGYSREEIDLKIPDILEFADIGDFIKQPVKSYSSGMFARLAFAVAINVEPDILIVDEALSVGDMFFQAKSLSRMRKLIDDKNTTVLFVSHDITSIKSLCSKAILLESGKLAMFNNAEVVTEEYFANRFRGDNTKDKSLPLQNSNPYNTEIFDKLSAFQRIQNGKISFLNVMLLDNENNLTDSIEFGQDMIIRCIAKASADIHNIAFGFHIRNRHGVDLLYDDTILQKHSVISAEQGETIVVEWKIKVLLQAGSYNVSVVCSIPIDLSVSEVDMCDFVPIAAQFSVSSPESQVYAALYANSTLFIKTIDVIS